MKTFKEYRNLLQLTNKELADAFDVGPIIISIWLRKNAPHDVLMKLDKAYKNFYKVRN